MHCSDANATSARPALRRVAPRLVATAAISTMVAVGAAASSVGAVATVCDTETHTWVGNAAAAPGAAIQVDVVVPVQDGTQLRVNAVDAASEPFVANALVVTIGGVPASTGGSVAGGALGVVNTTADPLAVTSIAVSLDRCRQVASAGPVTPQEQADRVGPTASELPTTTTAAPSSSVAPPQPTSAPTITPTTVAADPTLPSTGQSSWWLVLIATAVVSVGALAVAAARRMPSATPPR